MSASLTYRSYLRLPELLECQTPLSAAHDELLFISIHQASEIWMKLCLHELRAARQNLERDRLSPAFKMMARVGRIQLQLIQSWEVLGTMTPADYATMRAELGSSSGFQSDQYRQLEFLMGNKNPAMADLFRGEPAIQSVLRSELSAPSLYDVTLQLLARRGFAVPSAVLHRDFATPYVPLPEVEECWLQIYSDPERHWDLYELAEKLVDLEHHFQLWRFSHLKTVERIIGAKSGTGGTAGVPYLAKVLEKRFFPELLDVRNKL